MQANRSILSRLCLTLALLLSSTGLWAGTPQPTLPKVTLTIGKHQITAEIARTEQELSSGMMFRTRLGDNEGMLFCLTKEGQANFWMENTLIPLSVAYIDRTGKILEIHDMKPLDETNIPSTSDKIYYALETNQGWFPLNKIEPGEIIKPIGTTLDNIRNQKSTP